MIHSAILHTESAVLTRDYLAGWKRARAELDNYRKRVNQDQQDQRQHSTRALIEPLLELSDNFRAIVNQMPSQLQQNPWAVGVLHTVRQLESILQQYNVSIIDTVGTSFDPRQHEAVAHVAKKGVSSGQIIEIVQFGYLMGETVIRPAKVKVAK